MEAIEVEQRGAVRRLRLNRPEKLNAMSGAMLDELFAAFDASVAASDTRVIVISGAGRAFCSGADIKASSGRAVISNAPMDMVANKGRVERYLRIWSCPKPVIAQVHGYCIGMANEIVGAADLVVCGESARFGMPEARSFALPPTLGFWPARLGPGRTKELLYTGRWLEAPEALAAGLACAVHPDDELEAAVDALAGSIAETAPELLAVCKQAVNQWEETTGLPAAARRGAEYHAIYHQASQWHQATAKGEK